jgi:plastocyanin
MLRRLIVIASLLFPLTACGGSSPTDPSPTPSPSGTPVSIVQGAETLTTTAYAPNPVTISAGGTVTWKNNDSVAHTSTADAGGWDSGTIAAGAQFSHTFQTAGTFTYHCTIHPGMIGTVTVQ